MFGRHTRGLTFWNLLRLVSLRHLLLKPGRTALAVLGVCFGTALYVAIGLVQHATQDYFRQSVEAVAGKAELTVTSTTGESGLDEGLADSLERVPGVAAAVPVVESRSWIAASRESLLVLGVDLLQEKSVRSYRTVGKPLIGDSLTFITHPDSVVVTAAFARAHGLRLDSPLELTTSRGKARFTVRGILEGDSGLARAFGGNLALMDIDAARLAFGKEGRTDRIDVIPASGTAPRALARRLQAALGPSFAVEPPQGLAEPLERSVDSFALLTRFLSLLALAVGVLMISHFVSISVAERRREIGSVRALGASRMSVAAVFVSEALAMGTLGSGLGALLGRALASLMVGAVARALGELAGQRIDAGAITLSARDLLAAIALGAAAAAIAALWPATRAARISPVAAMKETEASGSAPKARPSLSTWHGWAGTVLLFGFGLGSVSEALTGYWLAQGALQLCAVAGVALLGPTLLLWALRAIHWLMPASAGLLPRMADENLMANPRRTRANSTVLVIGLTLVTVISCVNESFRGTLFGFFDRVLTADLLVSTTGRLLAGETQLLRPEIGDRLRAVPEVAAAYGMREINLPYAGHEVVLKAYDEPPVPQASGVSRYAILDAHDVTPDAAGAALFHGQEPAALVSDSFAAHFHVRRGDSIGLDTPTGRHAYRVAGVISEYASPTGTIVLSRSDYLRDFRDSLLGGFAVLARRGVSPLAARAAIERALPDVPLTILSNADIRAALVSTLNRSFAFSQAAEALALAIALMGLMNTILVSVIERTRELGLLRAVGMSRDSVSRLILLEAAHQGGASALIALAMGTLIASVWISHALEGATGWIIEFHFPWMAAGATFALGVGLTMLAAWYPARAAGETRIVEAIAHD